MQPTQPPRSARSAAREAVLGDDVADADAPARPAARGRSRRARPACRREVDDAVRDDDVDRLGRERDLLDLPLQELDVGRRRPRPRCAGRGRASRRSCRGRRPCRSGPTRWAESRTSMPPPEPRSSTVSPSRSSATAVGLPQPRLREHGRSSGSSPCGRRRRRGAAEDVLGSSARSSRPRRSRSDAPAGSPARRRAAAPWPRTASRARPRATSPVARRVDGSSQEVSARARSSGLTPPSAELGEGLGDDVVVGPEARAARNRPARPRAAP